MDDPTKAYGYDPFEKEGRDRWGRKEKKNLVPPEIPNYDIGDFLGEGGMATVWSAKFRPLNQPRALKVLSEAVAVDAGFTERFLEEAQALARLEHPNIVKVYDASIDGKRPYLAMDFVAGKTLSDILKTRNLTEEEGGRYFANIADALDYAHGIGFVHRDIKPSNVIIANTGKAMLIDFGVASWLGGVGESANAITGTTRYMSPEACRGDRVTKASDLWAFGVLMYRALTGLMPFDGKNEQEIFHAIINLPPKEPKHANPRVRAFLKKILDKDPEQRPKSAGAMVAEYSRAIRPFALKKHREGIAVGTSFFIAGVALLVVGGGIYGYLSTQRPVATKKNSFLKTLKEAVTGAGAAKTPDTPAGSKAATAPIDIQALSGIWYASFGSQWAEIRISPSAGSKFQATVMKRDQNGAQAVETEGQITSGSKFNFKEAAAQEGGSGLSFAGEMSSDASRVTGKLVLADGTSLDGEWVRYLGLAMTPYENSQLGYSISVPLGWKASAGDSTVISPVGRPDVTCTISSSPLNGAQDVFGIFKAREEQLASITEKGGAYTNVGSSTGTLGGKQAGFWELKYQAPGAALLHAKFYGVVRGDNGAVVEAWWPAAEEIIWAPVIDQMRQSIKFAD